VYLLEWDSYTKPLEPNVIDALAPAHAALHQRCRDAHAVLVAGLESVEARQLLAQWRHWLVAGIGEQGREAAFQPLGPRVARRIHKAQATLIERGRLIGPTSPPEQIHDLRKDAKKLRYLFECFGSLLADKPRKSFVRRLKAFQDNLGEYQDAEVHADELAGIARQLPPHQATPDTLLAIGQVIGLLDHRRAAARAEFDERFAVYDSKSTRRALDGALSAIER
jgi:CHAD domain-containing protein